MNQIVMRANQGVTQINQIVKQANLRVMQVIQTTHIVDHIANLIVDNSILDKFSNRD
jgi:hypothetical protein